MSWIKVDKDVPENKELILYNKLWIDEDFNPNGTRVGFYIESAGWISAKWVDYQDDYYTMSFTDNNYSVEEEPTHYQELPKGLHIK